MLQFQSLPPATLDVLRVLSKKEFLNSFRLVGGTALSLYWGHRISVDLDYFTDQNVNLDVLDSNLKSVENALMESKNPIGRVYSIQNVKCDFLNYPYAFLHPPQYEEGIQLGRLDDVVSLKLGALANRGAKKDIYDLYYILQIYPVSQLMEMYKAKYRVNDAFPLLKSLTYFADADEELPPQLLKDQKLSWSQIKKSIVKKVNEYVQ
jgi:predicted nucleotidyltransferase component of viral defense system